MAINGVNNDLVVTNDSTSTQPQQAQNLTEEKINSTFAATESEQETGNESVSVFNAKKGNVENTETPSKEHDKGHTKHDLVRPVSQFEIKNYLRDPRHADSNIYQKKMEELNKLCAKSGRTNADNIRLQNLKNDIRNIEQRVRYIIMSEKQDNPDIYEDNDAQKMFSVELVNVTDTQKVKADGDTTKETKNSGTTDNTENTETTENTEQKETKTTNDIDNTIGVKVLGMFSKNGTTVSGDVTLGNDYILNGSFEHSKNNSTFGVNGSAKIASNSEIDASVHAYYIYTKGTTEFTVKGNYDVYSAKIDNERERFQTGDVSLNVDTPNFGAEAIAEFTEIGNTYSVNARGSYAREWKNGITFDGTANAGYSYFDTCKAHTANFGLNARVSYTSDGIQGYAAIDASGNYTQSKLFNEKDFNVSGGLNLGVASKGFDFVTNVVYEKGSDASGLQCGAGLGYTFEKLGGTKVEVDYNQTISLTGIDLENDMGYPKHKIDVKIKAPLGQIINNHKVLKQTKNKEKAESIASVL